MKGESTKLGDRPSIPQLFGRSKNNEATQHGNQFLKKQLHLKKGEKRGKK